MLNYMPPPPRLFIFLTTSHVEYICVFRKMQMDEGGHDAILIDLSIESRAELGPV